MGAWDITVAIYLIWTWNTVWALDPATPFT
jgi:hypothetical protein